MRNTLRKLLSFLLVLTLILGSGYSSYAQNTSIHLKTGTYHQLESLSFFVYIEGTHGVAQPGVLEHVTEESKVATKLTMSTKGGSGQFTTSDLELAADPKIIHFEIGGFDYHVGVEITNIGKEGGGTMNYQITALPCFNLSYDVNTGTGTVPAELTPYMAGTTVNVLGNTNGITKADHRFTGWNTASDGSGTAYVGGNSFVMGFANVTLYAQWAPLYNVYYNANGGVGDVPTDINEYKPGDKATVATKGNLTKTDHTFAGWTMIPDDTGSPIQPSTQITIANSDVTLYAKWTPIPQYQVTYDGNGATTGNPPAGTVSYYTGANVTVLGNTGTPVYELTDYTFKGWSTAQNGSAGLLNVNNTFTMGTSHVVLYAQWLKKADPVPFVLQYNANGKSVTVPNNVPLLTGATSEVGAPSANEVNNFKFMGWNTSDGGTGTAYAPGSIITMGTYNITLYAQWTPFYTVSYQGNGNTAGTAPSDSIKYFTGNEVTVQPEGDLVKTHHTFGGWNTQPDGLGINYTTTFNMGNNNVILYAKWIPDPTFNVLYNANGATSGSVPVDGVEYFTADKPVVLGNTGTLALASFNFNGWNTTPSGSGTAYNASQLLTMGTSDIILYAQWSLTPPPPPPTTAPPTTEEPSTQPPSTQPPTTQPPTTQPSSEVLTNEPIPGNPAKVINFDEPLDSSTVEEVVELETEETPLAPALPQTGQLPVELFYGIGGLITAAGVFLKRNK